MEKLDLKDRKILYHLDLNSRQSFSQIGKKVGLHKDVVAYRVKKLVENGIIRYFYTGINDSKLGYSHIAFRISLQYITKEIKEEMIDYFIKSKYVQFAHSTEGHYDFVLIIGTKNIPEFYEKFWDKTLKKYRNIFANIDFMIAVRNYIYPYSFLLRDEIIKEVSDRKYDIYNRSKIVEIDDVDYDILKIIGIDTRKPTIEIADELNLSTITVKNRIKRLLDAGLINRFRVALDFTKLGYRIFKVFLILKDHNKINTIINYIEKNPNLTDIDCSIGYSDIELVFILKSTDQLIKIIDDLSSKFPETIKNYKYEGLTKTHKWVYMPEE